MEKNIDEYIKWLIELDSKAVEFKEKQDAEIVKLETEGRNELRSIENMLEETASAAKQEHDRILQAAKLQVKEMEEAADRKINELQSYYTGIREKVAKNIWKQLLEIER